MASKASNAVSLRVVVSFCVACFLTKMILPSVARVPPQQQILVCIIVGVIVALISSKA